MSLKILAFGGSNSRHSINKKLATFVARLFTNAEVNVVDLNDFEMPIFSVDRESQFPPEALRFAELIDQADLIVMSLAENNGSYSVAFKNIFDWVSRIPNRTVFNNKNILLLATSPGARGGMTVLETAQKRFPFNGGVVVGSMSLPSFQQNFKDEVGITNAEYLSQAQALVLQATKASLK